MSEDVEIQNEAMLTALNVRLWTGTRFDRNATDMVRKAAKASQDAGRYNKRLAAKCFISPLQKVASEARQEHYRLTLPWSFGDNQRLLPMGVHSEYEGTLGELSESFREARVTFFGQYDDMIEDARKRLGTMFNVAEYPTRDQLGDTFGFEWRYSPVPRGEDVTVPLSQRRLKEIRQAVESNVRESVATAMLSLYQRLDDALRKIGERLTKDQSGDAKVFRNSLIEHVRELVELVPKLNVIGDPQLAAVIGEIEERLLVVDNPDTLRPTSTLYDPAARKAVKAAADELSAKMAGFFGDR